MKVVFDGACLGDGPVTGVGRAFLNGLAAFAATTDAGCVLLAPRGTAVAPLANVQVVEAPRGALRRQLALPGLLRRLRADVLHSSVAAVPLRSPCPTIATVHDLPWLHPELGESTSAWRRFATRRSLAAAAAVVAPSAFTADDVRRWLGDRCPRLHVVPHGTTLGEAPDDARTRARSGPFLVLGDDRPRKNRAAVQQAHTLAAAHNTDLPPLRFVGPPTAYVDEAEKLRLLRECRALVQCSLFEGFGMPVLEALAHGAPVVCADIPPFREVAPAAALFVDPRDVEAIAAGLVRIHTDDPLRLALAREGHRLAASAQPPEVARRWTEVHRQVAR